jgi:hypothetical protein
MHPDYQPDHVFTFQLVILADDVWVFPASKADIFGKAVPLHASGLYVKESTILETTS